MRRKSSTAIVLWLCLVFTFTAILVFLEKQASHAFSFKTLKIPVRTASSLSKLYSSKNMKWEAIDPSYFHSPCIDGRRIAKDLEFLASVVNSWHQEVQRSFIIETSPILYTAEGDEQQTLYGHVLRRRSSNNDKLPVILLFHTGAGPHDVFLYYKADELLQTLDCLVMICDILSDADGWAWDPDRTRYEEVRAKLMDQNARLLKARVLAAIQSLAVSLPNAALHRIAAMGFCLGGQPILELSSLHQEHFNFSIRALITFHGIFARTAPLPTVETRARTDPDDYPIVLICNADDDPYVAPMDLENAAAFFRANNCSVEIFRVPHAKHGFTNPAQDFNPNPSFRFSPDGSILAWTKALALLRSTILS
jgi:dienelactone hydrolase